jgi:hypothetical protein
MRSHQTVHSLLDVMNTLSAKQEATMVREIPVAWAVDDPRVSISHRRKGGDDEPPKQRHERSEQSTREGVHLFLRS